MLMAELILTLKFPLLAILVHSGILCWFLLCPLHIPGICLLLCAVAKDLARVNLARVNLERVIVILLLFFPVKLALCPPPRVP